MKIKGIWRAGTGLLIAGGALLVPGCAPDGLSCGEGTVQQGTSCVPDDSTSSTSAGGMGGSGSTSNTSSSTSTGGMGGSGSSSTSSTSSGGTGGSDATSTTSSTSSGGNAGTNHKLLVSDDGVALASTPSLANLSQTVKVIDNQGLATPWSASSDKSWLTVTPSGMSGGDLVITANPAGLAANTVYYSTVTLSSSDPTVQYTDTVRVGLWVGSVTPAASATVSLGFSKVIADPIRPYAYVHNGGTDITIYNIYTAAVVKTISSVAPQLGDMTVSTDGSRLFAVDATNYRVVPIDLDAGTAGVPWQLGDSVPAILAYTRTGGKKLLIGGNGKVFDAATGTAFAATFNSGYYGSDYVSASQDGSRFCALDGGISPYSLTCYALAYDDASDQVQIGAGKESGFGVGSNGQDVAVSADGTRAYVASGAPYAFSVYDAATSQATMPVVQTLPGDAYPNNVEVMDNGHVLAGASVWYGPTDVWIYDAAGFQLGTRHLGGYANALLPGQVRASGDGLRMIALTDDPTLQFVTVGP